MVVYKCINLHLHISASISKDCESFVTIGICEKKYRLTVLNQVLAKAKVIIKSHYSSQFPVLFAG